MDDRYLDSEFELQILTSNLKVHSKVLLGGISMRVAYESRESPLRVSRHKAGRGDLVVLIC